MVLRKLVACPGVAARFSIPFAIVAFVIAF